MDAVDVFFDTSCPSELCESYLTNLSTRFPFHPYPKDLGILEKITKKEMYNDYANAPSRDIYSSAFDIF